jgi:hypothetical protein
MVNNKVEAEHPKSGNRLSARFQPVILSQDKSVGTASCGMIVNTNLGIHM